MKEWINDARQKEENYIKHEIDSIHQNVYNNIKQLMDQARNRVSREVNNILVQTYW